MKAKERVDLLERAKKETVNITIALTTLRKENDTVTAANHATFTYLITACDLLLENFEKLINEYDVQGD